MAGFYVNLAILFITIPRLASTNTASAANETCKLGFMLAIKSSFDYCKIYL